MKYPAQGVEQVFCQEAKFIFGLFMFIQGAMLSKELFFLKNPSQQLFGAAANHPVPPPPPLQPGNPLVNF